MRISPFVLLNGHDPNTVGIYEASVTARLVRGFVDGVDRVVSKVVSGVIERHERDRQATRDIDLGESFAPGHRSEYYSSVRPLTSSKSMDLA
jgi:hypothetical protein